MNVEKALKSIGLKQSEVEVYLALIRTGEASAGKLSTISRIHKKNIYDAANGLIKLGLASSVIKSGTTYWSPVSPEHLMAIIDERKAVIERSLPELLVSFNSVKTDKRVLTYDGKEGMRSFLNDILRENKPLKILAGTGKGFQKMGYYIYPWFKSISEHKIGLDVLFNNDAKIDEIKKEAKTMHYAFLPKTFSTPTQLFIYGEKTGIVIWSDEPLAIVIENKDITKGFEKYFEFLKSISKKES